MYRPKNEIDPVAPTTEPRKLLNLCQKGFNVMNINTKQSSCEAILFYSPNWEKQDPEEPTRSTLVSIGLFKNEAEAIQACRKALREVRDYIGYQIKNIQGVAA